MIKLYNEYGAENSHIFKQNRYNTLHEYIHTESRQRYLLTQHRTLRVSTSRTRYELLYIELPFIDKALAKQLPNNQSLDLVQVKKAAMVKNASELDIDMDILIVVPLAFTFSVLEYYHNLLGHSHGYHPLEVEIRKKFVGITRLMCKTFLQCCSVCRTSRSAPKKAKLAQPIQASKFNERWTMDLTLYDGRIILLCIDHFTKYKVGTVVPNKEAVTVFTSMQRFFHQFGYPDILQSDNGSEFDNGLFTELCKQKNIEFRHSKPYKPNVQGIVEAENFRLQKCLDIWRNNPKNKGKDWVQYDTVGELLHMMNIRYSRAIGHSPYFLVFNTHPKEFSLKTTKLNSSANRNGYIYHRVKGFTNR